MGRDAAATHVGLRASASSLSGNHQGKRRAASGRADDGQVAPNEFALLAHADQSVMAGPFVRGVVTNAVVGDMQNKGLRVDFRRNLDIAGAWYHEWQNTFATSAATLAGCAVDGVSSSQCAGTEDALSLVVD